MQFLIQPAMQAPDDARPQAPVVRSQRADAGAHFAAQPSWHHDGRANSASSPEIQPRACARAPDALQRPDPLSTPPRVGPQAVGTSKQERVYPDGRRKVTFANGTTKYMLPDGLSMVTFANGDIKKQLPDGTVEYFYKEVDTWHSTLPSRIEVRPREHRASPRLSVALDACCRNVCARAAPGAQWRW